MKLEREKEILNVGLSTKTLDPTKRFICSANELQMLEWNDYKKEYFTTYFKKGRIYIRYTKWTESRKHRDAYKIENEFLINFIPSWSTKDKYDYFIRFHRNIIDFSEFYDTPVSLENFVELEEIWKDKFVLKGDE